MMSETSRSQLRSDSLLDEGQKFALEAFLEGKSVAVIGGAGSGKSFFLNRLTQEAQVIHGDFPFVAPCALSNKAADALNGMTIHRLFAAKPSWEFSKEYLMKELREKPGICDRLKKIRVLLIDEISLLTSNLMDAIDFVLRELAESEWHSSLPLGGRQLIVAFDPFQLEPYPQHGSVQRETLHSSYQSRMWHLTFGPPGDGVVVVMGFNHRQSRDERFFQILNRIRVGTPTPGGINTLNKTSKGSLVPPRSYTRLCLKKDQVAQINYRKLESLPGLTVQSVAIDKYYPSLSVERIRSLRKRLDDAAPEKVELKVGAHIILTRKTEDMLPGTHAVVLRIVKIPSNNYEGVRFELELETCRTSEATGHPTLPCTEENRRFSKLRHKSSTFTSMIAR